MDYVDVETAKRLPGLRLVLTRGVPGPWSEAAKAIFHVKGLAYVAVAQEGGGENAELKAWTGQTSAPVAAWNDEPPQCTSLGILHLAERLAPRPALLPSDPAERAGVLAVCEDLVGEGGLGWSRRLVMLDGVHRMMPEGTPPPPPLALMSEKYGYARDAAAAARGRVVEILGALSDRLGRQRDAGRRFLFGDEICAADLYWATFAALFEPLPHELCPMPKSIRAMYTDVDPLFREALHPRLLEHRDEIYRRFLRLPVEF